MDGIYALIGKKIEEARKKSAQINTQEELARKASLQRLTIHKIERGLQKPAIDTLYRIAIALDKKITDLLPSDAEAKGYLIGSGIEPDRISQERFEEKKIKSIEDQISKSREKDET